MDVSTTDHVKAMWLGNRPSEKGKQVYLDFSKAFKHSAISKLVKERPN